MNLDNILELDQNDPLAYKREQFELPDGVIYLPGPGIFFDQQDALPLGG